MSDADFRGDCGRCVALCCVGLAFDRGALFAIDKLAGEACPHLSPDCGCAIHAERASRGFAGCVRFDCRGAGQLATALFNGLGWRDSEAVRRQMLRAFALLLEIQRLRVVLRGLGRPDLLPPLEPEGGWTLAALLATAPSAIDLVGRKLATLRTTRLGLDRGAKWGGVSSVGGRGSATCHQSRSPIIPTSSASGRMSPRRGSMRFAVPSPKRYGSTIGSFRCSAIPG